MAYNKLMKICLMVSVLALIASTAVFAVTDIAQKDSKVFGSVMTILQKLQLYSWPVAVVIMVYGMYQYYVVGSEAFEYKVSGQKLIMGLCVFMALIQCLPLLYAFITVGQ